MKLPPPTLACQGPDRQRGVLALVAAVVILVAATLITLYTASPVRTEQQVTGNERRSFQALNAAEAGLAFAMTTVANYDHDAFVANPNLVAANLVAILCSEQTLEGGGTFEITRVGGQSCADGWPPFGADEIVLGYRSIPVVVEGRSDDGVAFRALGQTYFLLDARDPNPPGGGGDLAPLNFAGPVTFDAPNSNSFSVDGGGGAAVATSSEVDRQHVLSAITGVGRADNYIGGVSGGGWDAPFDTAASLQTFINAIYDNPISGTTTTTTHQGNQTLTGNTMWSGINVVKGDMTFGGNTGGSGVLIVEGDLTTAGTPNWTGIIIVLGGDLTIAGGGTGGQQAGSAVFVANMDMNAATPSFGNTSFSTAGGGNAAFNYNADTLRAACLLLPDEALELWDCAGIGDGDGDDGSVDEPFAPQTGIISGSWIDFQLN